MYRGNLSTLFNERKFIYCFKIVYIKSNSSISGNEISDKLAKQAKEYESTLHLATYKDYVKSLKIGIIKEWP